MRKEQETLLECPVCGVRYEKGRTKVVSGEQNAILVHTNCQKCNTNSLAMFSRDGFVNDGMVTMGMLTDLYYDEALSMLGQIPISPDEVLEVYEKFSPGSF